MKIAQILFFLSLFLFSCDTKEIQANNEYDEFQKIIIIDTCPIKSIKKTASNITEAQISPLYIGYLKDSVSICSKSFYLEQYSLDRNYYRTSNENKLKIFIDTAKNITSFSSRSFIVPPPTEESKGFTPIIYTEEFIRSYPIYIKNISRDTLSIGSGEYLHLIIEAKDSLNKWRPIQTYYFYDCGTGLRDIYLCPNQTCISTCPIFEGQYETEMRIIDYDGKNKSNVFIGKMNYNQFFRLEE